MKSLITEEEYSLLLELQKKLNAELFILFEANKTKGRDCLASILVSTIDEIIDLLNLQGYQFRLCDYSGDINYENCEHLFSDGPEMSTGILLHFIGFSVQVSWEGTDKYKEAIN